MKLRLVTTQDARAVREIYRPAVEENAVSFEEEMPSVMEMCHRIERISRDYPWWVAEDEGIGVVGYAYAQPFRARSAFRFALECAVYVDASYRRRRVARALYEKLFRLGEAQGARTWFAAITLPNAASVALHESLGFAPAGIWPECGFKQERWWDVGLWARKSELSSETEPVWRPLSSMTGAEIGTLCR